ncbi:hypothetical protein P872_07615 [Rhodonellum psychrophilum GCM71 = DSM 17998]|uniref:Uncharacterized protein n=1 Tax=Rhodonellum psychrophilum GCM71 = DSM 17998 TaxID=1123057 RepID=U5BWS1_9BACT|nr:hypothetical protein P872_07615 [Rhodonellum psychrophilum GCM71 = DSM 17998]
MESKSHLKSESIYKKKHVKKYIVIHIVIKTKLYIKMKKKFSDFKGIYSR